MARTASGEYPWGWDCWSALDSFGEATILLPRIVMGLELKGIPEDAFQQLLIAKRNGFNARDRLNASLAFFRPVSLNPIRPTFEPNPLVARHLANHFVVRAGSPNSLLLHLPTEGRHTFEQLFCRSGVDGPVTLGHFRRLSTGVVLLEKPCVSASGVLPR